MYRKQTPTLYLKSNLLLILKKAGAKDWTKWLPEPQEIVRIRNSTNLSQDFVVDNLRKIGAKVSRESNAKFYAIMNPQ